MITDDDEHQSGQKDPSNDHTQYYFLMFYTFLYDDNNDFCR